MNPVADQVRIIRREVAMGNGCGLAQRYAAPVVIVVMGPAGAGKTTIGQAISAALGVRFVEGDEYHTVAAITKMRAGTPLTDADRRPWLASLHEIIATAVERREHLVVACSALHQRYRDTLRGDLRHVRFVYLQAGEATLRHRLSSRTGHFAGPALVKSQLAELEEPIDALTLDATRPVGDIVSAVGHEFGL